MNAHEQTSETLGAAAAKLSPSIGVAGIGLAGIPLSEWVLILTIIYTALMIAEKLWKWHAAWKAERDAAGD